MARVEYPKKTSSIFAAAAQLGWFQREILSQSFDQVTKTLAPLQFKAKSAKPGFVEARS